MPSRKVLKFAHEIDRGDILVVDGFESVVVTVNIQPETKSAQFELRPPEDPFNVFSVHMDIDDPFVIIKEI